jgi:hypothetical protein
VTSWLSWRCWAGCKAFRETGPSVVKGFTLSIEFSFEIEFEFELLSNSNFTQIKSRKIQLTHFTIF